MPQLACPCSPGYQLGGVACGCRSLLPRVVFGGRLGGAERVSQVSKCCCGRSFTLLILNGWPAEPALASPPPTLLCRFPNNGSTRDRSLEHAVQLDWSAGPVDMMCMQACCVVQRVCIVSCMYNVLQEICVRKVKITQEVKHRQSGCTKQEALLLGHLPGRGSVTPLPLPPLLLLLLLPGPASAPGHPRPPAAGLAAVARSGTACWHLLVGRGTSRGSWCPRCCWRAGRKGPGRGQVGS